MRNSESPNAENAKQRYKIDVDVALFTFSDFAKYENTTSLSAIYRVGQKNGLF